MIRIATATCIQSKLPNKYRYYFRKIWYAYHAAHWKGDFAAGDFLRYRWKHSENNKDNKRNFWSLYNCKIWMPWLILIKFIRCHFLSREQILIHQIQNSKLTSLTKSPFWCAAVLMLISALFSWRNVSSNTHQMWHNIFLFFFVCFNNYVLFLIDPSGSKPL